jgi:hypothetical protein
MDTLTWDLGYTLGTAWSQVQGGDVYASAALQSHQQNIRSWPQPPVTCLFSEMSSAMRGTLKQNGGTIPPFIFGIGHV